MKAGGPPRPDGNLTLPPETSSDARSLGRASVHAVLETKIFCRQASATRGDLRVGSSSGRRTRPAGRRRLVGHLAPAQVAATFERAGAKRR